MTDPNGQNKFFSFPEPNGRSGPPVPSAEALGLPASLPPHLIRDAEAYAFRRLLLHLQQHPELQNMDAMSATGFCRNCLAKWMLSGFRDMAPLPLADPLRYDDVAAYVYGMPQKEWKKKYQLKATPEQMATYEASKALHAIHAEGAQEPVPGNSSSTLQSSSMLSNASPASNSGAIVAPPVATTTQSEKKLDPCCPDSSADISNLIPPLYPGIFFKESTVGSGSGKHLDIADLVRSIPSSLDALTVGVLTVSDRASNGVYTDESGPEAIKCVEEFAKAVSSIATSLDSACRIAVTRTRILPDDISQIEAALREWSSTEELMPNSKGEESRKLPPCNLIITTGGTGYGARDVTPEATTKVLAKRIPGLTSMAMSIMAQKQPLAYLSRSVTGVTESGTVIINTPGSPSAVREYLQVCLPFLVHAVAATTP